MKRSIVFHEGPIRFDNLLLCFLVVLGALVMALTLATTAAGATAYYSFTGGFTNGTETQSFLFNLNSPLRSPAPFTLRTWHYGGGTNAAGDTIAAGGFDPILRLYNDTPALIAENDDYNPPMVRDSLINWSTSGMPAQLPADDYKFNLVAYNGTLGGRTGNWAVDLVSDAAKFTLTGVDKSNGSGATTVSSLTIGSDDVRLPAKVQVGTFQSLSLTGPLVVGDSGAGEVTVTTGALATNTGGLGLPILGYEPGSVGTITLKQGGSWVDNLAIIQLGWQGTGNLVIESGGLASFNNVISLGEYPSGEGNLTVRGVDSILVTNQSLSVGDSGMGYVRIEDRGKVYSTGEFYAGGDAIGAWENGRGTVEVDGKDSLWSSSTFIVGDSGQGSVNITNGGKISVLHNAYIGHYATSHDNSVTLTGAAPDGAPATWQVSGNLYIAGGEFNSSNAANSKLTINPGGRVDVAGTTTVWSNGGNLELLGGEMKTGSLIVKLGATFTHTDGTLKVDGGTFDPGPGGFYVITGADSADRPKVVLTNGADSVPLGWLIVGQDNDGELSIQSGSTLSATNVATSYAPTSPSTSRITVQGAGSRLIVTDPAMSFHSLEVGASSQGELIVSAGGQVQVQQGGVSLACCLSAYGPGSGQVTVQGENSRLEATYINFRAGGSNSHVTIRDHGFVHATDPHAYNEIWSASFTDTTIDVEVTDAGSLLQIDGDVLNISGDHWEVGSQARLTVRNGGAAQVAGDVWLTGDEPGAAYVDVDGGAAGTASLSVVSVLYVGGDNQQAIDGTAQLTVANNGLVTAGSVKVWQPGTVELNNGVISTGSLELAGGTLRGNGSVIVSGQVTNSGVVAPGLSAGSINISGGNYEQDAAGTLEIEIASPLAYDRLNVTSGWAYLNGTLAVSLIDPAGGTNPFVPSGGEVFHIVTAAGNVSFSPNWTVLPTLRGGLYWSLGTPTPQSLDLGVGGVVGDYNHNGVVDPADYVFWRYLLDKPTSPWYSRADGDGDGVVDIDDYGVWRAHFGQLAVSAAMLSSDGALPPIPEPASVALIVVAAGALLVLHTTRLTARQLISGRTSS